MAAKTVQSGDDGAVDHHGEALPTLSKSASHIDIEKIERARRLSSKPGEHPGVAWFYRMMRELSRMAIHQIFRTIEVTGQEHIAKDAGILTVGWHTNGLIDPVSLVVTQPKMFVFGGRHDLITRPIIGPLSSLAGAQPVIRQAELARGGTSKEVASRINSKTMLTLAECIAHGHGTALFPEGTSHEDAKMRRLRTGPMRSVIAANSIAHEKELSPPHLLPVGLHYRTQWDFRTDAWFEYGEPISLVDSIHPAEDRARLMNGEWVEAPADIVNDLRDEVCNRLTPMTPDASTWEEHRAWHVLGHLRAISTGEKLGSWREEVLAARSVRDDIRDGDTTLTSLQSTAHRIGETLHTAGLDGRALDSQGLRTPSMLESLCFIPALLLALLSAPLTLYGSGVMILIGKILGDNTDEGLDARASYHFLASQLGPLIVWPFPIGIFVIVALVGPWTIAPLHIALIAILLPLAFHISNKVATLGWNLHITSRDARSLNRLRHDSKSLVIVKDITDLLAALK
ncbi:MAG: 1-acyl-sn-glycerol-3-phosphate acyltransferase [Candidatus Thalassarchaeaceae archaeon]|nr:1-acyl-sn-glycerol-3-phosphate acyltransferase [Candidatus Thalassarchaeaceae archaeon]